MDIEREAGYRIIHEVAAVPVFPLGDQLFATTTHEVSRSTRPRHRAGLLSGDFPSGRVDDRTTEVPVERDGLIYG